MISIVLTTSLFLEKLKYGKEKHQKSSSNVVSHKLYPYKGADIAPL